MNKELRRNIDKWITNNWNHYTSEVRNNIAKGKMGEHSHDLCVHCYESFMSKTEEQHQQMLDDNKILNYLLYCCSFQLRSSTSPFYSQYRKHGQKSIPEYFGEQVWDQHNEVNLDDYYECAMEALNSDLLDFYEKKLIELKYIEQLTFQQIFDEYNFTHISSRRHLHGALEKIEIHCNNKIEK